MSNLSKIHFQDEDFIRKNSLRCHLFLQIEANLCKVLICDKERNLHNVEELDTEDFLDKKWRFTNLKFAQSTIIALPETFIFIPEEFESEDQQTLIKPFLDAGSLIFSTPIKNTAINTYFTVSKQVLDFQNILNANTIIPSANLLIQQILSTASENTEVFGINFYKDKLELVYIKNRKFVFYNSFPKANADDFNYYLLSVLEQFGIQAASTIFYLAGDIDVRDENYGRLAKYTSNIHFLADLNREKASTILESNFSNQFFLLSELSECV